MKNKLFIGNVVSFNKKDGCYRIDLVNEGVKLYQISKISYIDISNIEEENIEMYVKEVLINFDKTKILSSLSLQKYFSPMDSNVSPYCTSTLV